MAINLDGKFYNVEWFTNSVLKQNEVHTVTQNKFYLDYIPDDRQGITMTNSGGQMVEVKYNGSIQNTSQFKIDYSNGKVEVLSSLNGTNITVTQYYAKGKIKIPADRIDLIDTNNYYSEKNVESALQETGLRLTNLLQNTQQASEVVDARTGVIGETNATLKNRLDKMESNLGKITSVSTNTTLTTSQRGMVHVTTGASNLTVTLPIAVSTAVMKFVIKKVDTGLGYVTIATQSSQLIDNQSTISLRFFGDSVTLYNNGTGWNIEGKTENTSIKTASYTLEGIIASLGSDVVKGNISEAIMSGRYANSIIKDGNFPNGTNWSASGASLSTSGNIGYITGNGTGAYPQILQTVNNGAVNGKKIYGRMKARVTGTGCTAISLIIYKSGGTSISKRILNPVQNQWYDLETANIFTQTQDGNLLVLIVHEYADSSSANGKVMEVKEVMAIDMGVDSTNPLYSKTANEMNILFPYWLGYGLKQVQPHRVASYDFKNIVQNGNFANGTTGWSGAGSTVSATNNVLSVTATASTSIVDTTSVSKWSANKKVYVSAYVRVTGTGCQGISVQFRDSLGGASAGTITISNPNQNQWYFISRVSDLAVAQTGNIGIRIYHQYADATTANGKVMEVKEVMAIDMGTDSSNPLYNKTANEMNALLPIWFDKYRNYTEAYCPVQLNQVSESIKDTFDLVSGKHTKNVNSKVLVSGDVTSMYTTYTNLDYAVVTKPLDYKSYGNYEYSNALIENYVEFSDTNFDSATHISQFSTRAGAAFIWVGFAKGTTLAQAQTALTGKTIYYQLVTPVITYYPPQVLVTGANYTVIQEPMYQDIKTTNAEGILLTHPIKSFDTIKQIKPDSTLIDIATSSATIYRENTSVTASSGTNTTNLTITAHGLSVNDRVYNVTRNVVSRVSAVVDANNVTLSTAITGQTTGDSIKTYKTSVTDVTKSAIVVISGSTSGNEYQLNYYIDDSSSTTPATAIVNNLNTASVIDNLVDDTAKLSEVMRRIILSSLQ